MPERHAIRLGDRARLQLLRYPESTANFLRKQLFVLADDAVELSEPLVGFPVPHGQAFRFRCPFPEPEGTFFTITFQYDQLEIIVEVADFDPAPS